MRRIYSKIQGNKKRTFEIDKAISHWWSNEPAAAKIAFLSALIIGFISHLFIYTGRYYGRDDMGVITRYIGPVATGRWFNGILTSILTDNYVLPLVYGILVTLFLAIAAFYVCKIFDIQKKINAVLIGSLLSTFPSIANTNLFLYETATYHFAVLLAVLAVYITIKYRYGFLGGAILSMLTLATYQSKFNIVIALCLFYSILNLLQGISFYKIKFVILKFVILIGLGGVLYAISLPISMHYFNTSYNAYRGMSPDGMLSRLLSINELIVTIESTYKNFYDGFFGNFYLMIDNLKYAYVVVATLAVLFIIKVIWEKNIYRKVIRLTFIIILIILTPLACNFSDIFDTSDAYGLMIYSFVFVLVFFIVISEQSKTVFPLIKSIFILCMFFIISNYIVGNNIYYSKAYYSNQRTYSLTVRVLDRIEPLLPLTTSNRVTVYGSLPNEYLPQGVDFGTPSIREGSAVGNNIFLNYDMGPTLSYSIDMFGLNINYIHGVKLSMLTKGEEWEEIREEVLNTNMPVWPAEGSVGIINDVVVVNFGLVDVVFESDENGQFYHARHWVSDGHAQHIYEYHWQVYQNGMLIDSPITNSDRLYLDIPDGDDIYQVTVSVRNTNTDFGYSTTLIK